jgi:hypothetical protein
MIITRRDDALCLVTQVEHARVAAELCSHWGNDDFEPPAPAASVRLAAELHDDGWRAADEEPLLNAETGRPLHFLEIDLADHVAFYRHGVEGAMRRDAYSGLLVSMHWTGLYRSRWGLQSDMVFAGEEGPAAQLIRDAIDDQERHWIELKRPLMSTGHRSDFEARLWHNYDLLQAFDVLSLYLCTATLTPGTGPALAVTATLREIDQASGPRTIDAVPQAIGAERAQLRLETVASAVVAVDPYPFDSEPLRVAARGRLIAERRYDSAATAAAALAGSTTVDLSCELVRA